MNEPIKMPLVCRNGHQQPSFAEKFCIYCGAVLEVSNSQANRLTPPALVSVQPPNQQSQAISQPSDLNRSGQGPINPPQFDQNYRPSPGQQIQPRPPQVLQALSCYKCGGNGQSLDPKTIICDECNWLRPLNPGYRVDSSTFAWAADGKAMAALRSMKTLNAAAQAVSEKVGRRWIESTFNGVLLGEKQLPQIYGQAVRAARILGMSHMPELYLSGDRPWDCLTFGTDKDSFIVIGSALAGNFHGPDLLFLLAREMGHCRAGHALWKTVIRFFLGEQGPGKGMMSGGIFNAILNPTALISGAFEVPLLAWARQAEITADRAGLLTVGDEEVARRVLLSWSLKSSFIYRQINLDAWLEQQAEDDEGYSRLSELTTSSTPYIGPRLKLLTEFAKSPELKYWRQMILASIEQGAPKSPAKPAADPQILKIKCATCQTQMVVPLKVLAGKKELPVKCPNKQCGKITRLKKTVKPQEAAAPAAKPAVKRKQTAAKKKQEEENLNYVD